MVDTAAMAGPLLMVFDLPASANTNGTMHEVPMPTNAKPVIAAGTIGTCNRQHKAKYY